MSADFHRPQPASGHNKPTTYDFAVYAEATPDLMPRVLDQFAKRSLVPTRWYSALVDGFAPQLQIDVRVTGVDEHQACHIARCLERLVHVQEVVTARG